MTCFHHCIKLRLSNAQGCQALTRGSRFHSVVTNLSHQSRRTLPRDWVASKVAVHEDCDLVSLIFPFFFIFLFFFLFSVVRADAKTGKKIVETTLSKSQTARPTPG